MPFLIKVTDTPNDDIIFNKCISNILKSGKSFPIYNKFNISEYNVKDHVEANNATASYKVIFNKKFRNFSKILLGLSGYFENLPKMKSSSYYTDLAKKINNMLLYNYKCIFSNITSEKPLLQFNISQQVVYKKILIDYMTFIFATIKKLLTVTPFLVYDKLFPCSTLQSLYASYFKQFTPKINTNFLEDQSVFERRNHKSTVEEIMMSISVNFIDSIIQCLIILETFSDSHVVKSILNPIMNNCEVSIIKYESGDINLRNYISSVSCSLGCLVEHRINKYYTFNFISSYEKVKKYRKYIFSR